MTQLSIHQKPDRGPTDTALETPTGVFQGQLNTLRDNAPSLQPITVAINTITTNNFHPLPTTHLERLTLEHTIITGESLIDLFNSAPNLERLTLPRASQNRLNDLSNYSRLLRSTTVATDN